MNVVLLATGRLNPASVETARADLGGEDLVLDVIGWVPPREPLGAAGGFVLVGPGRMPQPAEAPPRPLKKQEQKKQEPLPMGIPRLVAAARWRYRRLRRWTGRLLRIRRNGSVSRAYWSAIRSRAEALAVIDRADVVVAMDAAAIRAGWKLSRRRAVDIPVVYGIPAAKHELGIAS